MTIDLLVDRNWLKSTLGDARDGARRGDGHKLADDSGEHASGLLDLRRPARTRFIARRTRAA